MLANRALYFYVRLSVFSPFLGEPVQIALTLDIASISSISESNMVRQFPAFHPLSPFPVFIRKPASSYAKQEQRLLGMAGTGEFILKLKHSGRCL